MRMNFGDVFWFPTIKSEDIFIQMILEIFRFEAPFMCGNPESKLELWIMHITFKIYLTIQALTLNLNAWYIAEIWSSASANDMDQMA